MMCLFMAMMTMMMAIMEKVIIIQIIPTNFGSPVIVTTVMICHGDDEGDVDG